MKRNIHRFTLAAGGLIAASVVFFSGILIGRSIGGEMLRAYITGRSGIGILLYTPSFRYIESMEYLNSNNELTRLSGYYSMFFNNKIDVSYLFERYNQENSTAVKRTIIWLIGFTEEKKTTIEGLKRIFKTAGPEVRHEIIRTVGRINEKLVKGFTGETTSGK